MPFFTYRAKNKFGETLKGKVEAASIDSAARELGSRELIVIELHPLTEDSFAELKALLFGVKKDDIVNLTRQMATMITAGLSLSGSLSILVRQSKPEISKLVASLLTDVEGGTAFAKALSKHPKAFSPIYVQLVLAGEAGGVLDQILERLAENLEKEKEFRSKTKGALIYPVIVLIAMFVVGLIMMIFVIPQMTEMYKDFGAELPFLTQMLITVSDFFASYWYVFGGGAAIGILFFVNWSRTTIGKRSIDGFLQRVPIVGDLRKKIMLTEFARTLSLLLGAGISMLQALEIVKDSVESILYQEAMEEVTSQVEKGVPLSEAMGHYEMFPPILHQMIGVGEETGKLDEVLLKLSAYFEQESEQAVKNLTAAIEPLIMIVLGVGVGVMVIAVIMPIYNLTAQF